MCVVVTLEYLQVPVLRSVDGAIINAVFARRVFRDQCWSCRIKRHFCVVHVVSLNLQIKRGLEKCRIQQVAKGGSFDALLWLLLQHPICRRNNASEHTSRSAMFFELPE